MKHNCFFHSFRMSLAGVVGHLASSTTDVNPAVPWAMTGSGWKIYFDAPRVKVKKYRAISNIYKIYREKMGNAEVVPFLWWEASALSAPKHGKDAEFRSSARTSHGSFQMRESEN